MDSGATSPAGGRPLVELFSVRALSLGCGGGTPPCGKVTVFDGRRGQIVYSRSRDEPHHSSSHAQDELVLTGPHRAIPGDGTSVIELDLHHSNQEPAPPPYMRVQEKEEEEEANLGLIHWDIHNPSQEHDKPISRTVDTRYGPVEVSYAVLSNAVEAEVVAKLKLLRPPLVEEDVDGDGGFENAVQGCCGTGLFEAGYFCSLSTSLLCGNANKYVFFDAIHPTERMYKILADTVINTTLHVFL